ncbi:MAG: shikimate dehydrogenase [Propionibacteriaceae bacterium]|nr:shikimate dehydrogenase [Propionibacteriaceae bacterium]
MNQAGPGVSRQCGVIGSPIAHSLSPALHRAAYQWLGLDWHYSRHEVTALQTGQFVAGLDSTWRGLSVTMPCKKAIVELGRPDPVVAAVGVGNTLVFHGLPRDMTTTTVHCTDVAGVQMVLADAGMDPQATIVIYGNGATARSCVYAAYLMGVERVQVRARDQEKTALLAQDAARWGIEVVSGESRPDVVISTVPASVAAEWGTGSAGLVFDVLYSPWPTPLASQAARQGARVASGLDLLAAQAVTQVELMTGRSVDFSVLRTAADQAIAARSQ